MSRSYADAVTDQRIAARGGRPYPERITAALDLRGLYGPEVDEACGAVEPAVDRWETGEEVPTRRQLELLAELTDFPVGFFFLEPGPSLDCGWFCIRSGKGKGCYRADDPRLEQALAEPPEQLALTTAPQPSLPVPKPDMPPPGPLPECSGCARPMRRRTWTAQHGRCSRCGPS